MDSNTETTAAPPAPPTSTPKCTRCKSRPRGERDVFLERDRSPRAGWCQCCRSAHKMVHTSVDEAIRHDIPQADMPTLLAARVMELESLNARVSVLNAIDRRLRKLAKEKGASR